MKLVFSFFLLTVSLTANAERFKSKIHSIDTSPKKGVPHLIKLENGRVLFIKSSDRALMNNFRESLKKQDMLEVEVDENNNFIAAESVKEALRNDSAEEPEPEARMSYDPSVVSLSTASSIFSRMRRDYQNQSQCYNRAHIWAWEEFNKTGLKSIKLFLFFTSRYIRNYRYKWWFHVSPMVKTTSGDRVLDRRYTSGTRQVSTWTRNFVYSGKSCPVVHRYYDYRNNQQSQDCYLIPVSMYFWQPRDIEQRDRTGYEKTQFYKSEVDYAYWEAF